MKNAGIKRNVNVEIERNVHIDRDRKMIVIVGVGNGEVATTGDQLVLNTNRGTNGCSSRRLV
jgi:hypothetical protein